MTETLNVQTPSRRGRTVGAILVTAAVAALAFALVRFHDINVQSRAQTDRVALESLRTCIRSNINAAVVKASLPPASRLARNLYPILDCKQSQASGKSVVISPAETRKYVALVLRGRAPIINEGHVVGSRATVLQGVSSVADVGHQ